MITIKEVNSFEELVTLKDDWNDILNYTTTSTIFQTFEWIKNYLHQYKSEQILILLAYLDNKLIGIAPLQKKKQKKYLFTQKKITFIGEIFSEYNDFIILPEYNIKVLIAFTQYLSEKYPAYYLDLRDLPTESITNIFLERQNKYFKISIKGEPYLYINTNNFEEYLTKFTKKSIQTIRRKIKKIEANEFCFIFSNTITNEELNLLKEFNIKRHEHKGTISFFSDENNYKFISDILISFNGTEKLFVSKCIKNNKIISLYLCFLYRNKIYFFLSGFDFAYNTYSLGGVHLFKIIEYCFKEKYSEFDFLRGSDEYKFRYHPQIRYPKRHLVSLRNNVLNFLLFVLIKIKHIKK